MTISDTTAETQAILLAHLDAIAASPGGLARLRQLILQLAVQGRLVAQDPNDEPASVLLERIRCQLKAREPDSLGNVELKTDSDIPDNWAMARIGDVTEIVRGITFPASAKFKHQVNGSVPCLRTANVQEEIDWDDLIYVPREYVKRTDQWVKESDIIISMANSKELVGKVALVEKDVKDISFGGFLSVIRAIEVNPTYLCLALRSPEILGKIRQTSSQTVNIANISLGGLRPILIPLPPLAEQRRIVARVDALLALCDALEQRQAQQDAERQRLLKALVAMLLAARDAEAAEQAWAQLSASFELVLAAPEDVAPLRQAVLQLAVQGRLVEQDPSDEPASVLLERIRAEKARLVQEGKLKKAEPAASITTDEQPFAVPEGWEWARFGETLIDIQAGWSPLCDPHPAPAGEWAVLKISAVSWGRFDPSANKRLLPEQQPRTDYEVHRGDFLMSRANTAELIARSVVVEQEVSKLMLSDKVLRVQFPEIIDRFYANFVNNSRFARHYYASTATGTSDSMKNVTRQQIRDLPFPLPPLAEQRRIVARVDALMALCDALEARLREQRTATEQLAEGLCAAVVAGRGWGADERRQPIDTQPQPTGARPQSDEPLVVELPRRVPVFDLEAYAVLAAHVVQQHQGTPYARTLGHVKLEKIAHLAEGWGKIDLSRQPHAMPRGPADFALLKQVIAHGRERNAFAAPARQGSAWGYQFVALPELDALAGRFTPIFGPQAERLQHLIGLLLPLKSRPTEIAATLYAVWNDLLRAGESPDDAQIFDAFRSFHPAKEHFSETTLQRWLDWMREHGLIPDGSAKVTLAARTQPAAPAPINLAAVRQQNTLVRRAAENPVAYAADEGYAAAVALLAERGSLSNGELQRALGLDGAIARALLQQLVAAGLARVEGQRRGTRYVWVGGRMS